MEEANILVCDLHRQYAISIVYNMKYFTPIVIAQKRDSDAKEMIQVAQRYGVETFCNDDLTMSLFKQNGIYFIPENLYEPISELIATALKLNNTKNIKNIEFYRDIYLNQIGANNYEKVILKTQLSENPSIKLLYLCSQREKINDAKSKIKQV